MRKGQLFAPREVMPDVLPLSAVCLGRVNSAADGITAKPGGSQLSARGGLAALFFSMQQLCI